MAYRTAREAGKAHDRAFDAAMTGYIEARPVRHEWLANTVLVTGGMGHLRNRDLSRLAWRLRDSSKRWGEETDRNSRYDEVPR